MTALLGRADHRRAGEPKLFLSKDARDKITEALTRGPRHATEGGLPVGTITKEIDGQFEKYLRWTDAAEELGFSSAVDRVRAFEQLRERLTELRDTLARASGHAWPLLLAFPGNPGQQRLAASAWRAALDRMVDPHGQVAPLLKLTEEHEIEPGTKRDLRLRALLQEVGRILLREGYCTKGPAPRLSSYRTGPCAKTFGAVIRAVVGYQPENVFEYVRNANRDLGLISSGDLEDTNSPLDPSDTRRPPAAGGSARVESVK